MLDSGPAVQAQALDEAKALGADVIRANVIWARFAPSPDLQARSPSGFDGKDPAAYPAGAFGDARLVRRRRPGARHAGAADADRADPGVGLALQAARSRTRARLQARSEALRRVRARARHALPDRQEVVDLERAEPALVAEPAVRGRRLAAPSSARPTCTARSRRRRSPACARTGAPRPTRSGSARPRRSATTRPAAAPSARCGVPRRCATKILKTSPETFLRGVFCLSTKGRRLTGAEASRPALRRLQEAQRHRLRAPSVHARRLAAAALADATRGEITISVASRLTRLLDQAAQAPSGSRPSCRSTTPSTAGRPSPDLIFGVTDAQQAEYINQSDWIAYNNPRVHTVAQYKIVDDANIGAGFQMGLRLLDGARASRPTTPTSCRSGSPARAPNVTVYGQVRPADNGTAADRRHPERAPAPARRSRRSQPCR